MDASIRELVLHQMEALPEQTRNAIPDADAYVNAIVAQELTAWQSPWFKPFLEYDPRPAIVLFCV